MDETRSGGAPAATALQLERILGAVRGAEPGPTLICVGGVHGNEPAGVLGIQRVLAALSGQSDRIRGELVGLAGNLAALALGSRFVSEDLNRLWSEERVHAVRNGGWTEEGLVEERELEELLHEIEEAAGRARGAVYFLDLHTTSGPRGVFATVGDTLRNREFALSIPTPLVLGLEELVEGTLLAHMDNRGHVAAAFESGQHEDPASVDRAEAAVWIAAATAGLLDGDVFPRVRRARESLRAETSDLPRALEMKYRHPVVDGDGFRMRAGYRNFQRVDEGEVIATDRHGVVRAPASALLLMPLYQKQGRDGFFVVREFSRFWLRLSSVMRRLRVDRIVHLLPGVSRHPERDDALVANRLVARWFALELFHLLGYRRQLEEGPKLVVVRRRFDQ